MTQPAFLTDEDFRQDIVDAALRIDGQMDVTRVRDVGLSAAPDAELLHFAFNRSRIIVSHDANTMIAAAVARIEDGSETSGLVIVPQSANRMAVAGDLVLIANASDAEEWVNRIEFLPWGRP